MNINVTELAAKKITRQLEKRGSGVGIRVGVKTTGCSGLAYILEYVDEILPADEIIKSNGVNIIADPKSLVYINGLTINYVRKGLNEGYEFINPNEKDRCGCGESFRV
jgi:iron-sulfur cluster assembly protein